MRLGYALICEEHGPSELLASAQRAEAAGFGFLSVSDHFHPWLDDQGQSPFAWSVLGALAVQGSLPLLTAVTCPIKRYHPAVVAQMAATVAVMAPGRFTLGLGAGENLNEHVVGGEWPDPATRLDHLEEAMEVIRRLGDGEDLSYRGRWVTVDRARLYTRPHEGVPLAVAAGGPAAAALAGRVGAGLITVGPRADLVEEYRGAGGEGPVIGQGSVCWHEDADKARSIVREHWRQGVLGWDANADIPTPAGFAAATQTVRDEDVGGSKPLGADLDVYLESLSKFDEAGYDHTILHNIGPEQHDFLDWAGSTLLPAWTAD